MEKEKQRNEYIILSPMHNTKIYCFFLSEPQFAMLADLADVETLGKTWLTVTLNKVTPAKPKHSEAKTV